MKTEVAVQRPVALLGGLFAGCASVTLTFGLFWMFAPIIILAVVAVAWFSPHPAAPHFATGALAALVGMLVFGTLTLALTLI